MARFVALEGSWLLTVMQITRIANHPACLLCPRLARYFRSHEVTRSVSEGECLKKHAKPRVLERFPSLTLRVTWLSRLRKLKH